MPPARDCCAGERGVAKPVPALLRLRHQRGVATGGRGVDADVTLDLEPADIARRGEERQQRTLPLAEGDANVVRGRVVAEPSDCGESLAGLDTGQIETAGEHCDARTLRH